MVKVGRRRGLPMVAYHSTQELLALVTALSCSGPQYKTFVRNQTIENNPVDLTAVVVNADSQYKSAAEDNLRVMLTFGIHGREHFSAEVGYKYEAPTR